MWVMRCFGGLKINLNKLEGQMKSDIQIPSGVKVGFFVVVLLLLITMWTTFNATDKRLKSVRVGILESLREMDENARVFIDGKPIKSAQVVIKDLCLMGEHRAHHSHPGKRFRIRVDGSDNSVILELGRDSEIQTEYWVFNPQSEFFKDTIIGSFQSEFLSDYP